MTTPTLLEYTDALVIGAGPAGASIAIRLATAGWRVMLVEQHSFPRQKVCGECIAPGNFALLDELGLGTAFLDIAGPELTQVGWMGADDTFTASMPVCPQIHGYGRALGRDRLDTLLVERAREVGVHILQPAKVRRLHGAAGAVACEIEARAELTWAHGHCAAAASITVTAAVVIDAHGSWEAAPAEDRPDVAHARREPRRDSDLFAFKATFGGSSLPRHLLPVLSFEGGYGGMVVADAGRTTLACCIRRDVLRAQRARQPGATAGVVVEEHLRNSCRGAAESLRTAYRIGNWLSVGPIRPGARTAIDGAAFQVGNAIGETHPLIGEGISMTLQSATLLAGLLLQHPAASIDGDLARRLKSRYVKAWRAAFGARLRLAGAYAHVAMHPSLAAPAQALLRRWPALMTHAAHFAGKDRRAIGEQHPQETAR